MAEGQRALGALYRQGELVAKNSNEARKWLHKAAAQNDVLAHFDLGCIYQFGLGVPRDYAEAEKWYRLPVEKGNADAISNMKQLKESIAAEEEQR